jgi:hypothetical protein
VVGRLCFCECVRAFVFAYVCTCVRVRACVRLRFRWCVSSCASVCMCLCDCVCACVCVCAGVCNRMCTAVLVCALAAATHASFWVLGFGSACYRFWVFRSARFFGEMQHGQQIANTNFTYVEGLEGMVEALRRVSRTERREGAGFLTKYSVEVAKLVQKERSGTLTKEDSVRAQRMVATCATALATIASEARRLSFIQPHPQHAHVTRTRQATRTALALCASPATCE